jgi:hypothetical protein
MSFAIFVKSWWPVQARDLRIEALEADNYGDATGAAGADSDDAYDIASDMEAGAHSTKSRRTERTKAATSTSYVYAYV